MPLLPRRLPLSLCHRRGAMARSPANGVYTLYLRGLKEWNRRNRAGASNSRELFERAVPVILGLGAGPAPEYVEQMLSTNRFKPPGARLRMSKPRKFSKRRGILAMGAPDGLAHIFIGRSRYGAGVQNHQDGAGGCYWRM